MSPAEIGPEPDADTVTELLAFRTCRTRARSRASLGAAWENARGAREAISSEMWEMPQRDPPRAAGASRACARRARPATTSSAGCRSGPRAAGLADSTMSRDDGWRFLVLGRSLERVDMTARLLSARFGDAVGQTGWTTTLRCCSAHEAFLRTYRRAVDASQRGRVPAARPAVPPLRVPRAHARPRTGLAELSAHLGAGRRRRRGPPRARAGPAPTSSSSASRSWSPTCPALLADAPAGLPRGGRRRGRRALLPARPRVVEWSV